MFYSGSISPPRQPPLKKLVIPRKRVMEAGDGSSKGAAVERVVPSAGVVELPLLTKGNYQEWSLVMQVSLEALELWEVVEEESKDRAKDRRALAAILRGVPPEMKAGLAVKKTAKEAWDSVKKMRGGDDRVKAANVQQLMKEFENLNFRDGEAVGDFAVRVNRLTARLGNLGEVVPDSRVVRKVLRAVPRRLKQVAVSIEIHGDLNNMSLDELVGQLQVAEQADAEDEAVAKAGGGDQLLLTRAQWEARSRQRGGGRRRSGGEHGGGHGGDHDDDDDTNSSTSSGRGGSRYRGRCFDCGARGHMARECPKKRKEKALLADVDEEPTLL
ncbi:unnamed protein product [Urochloa humidicola]